MGFCRICFIVYMLCTRIAGTERNYRSQWIITLKIFICVHSRYGCYFSADTRAEHQGVLYANVFRKNNDQIYFNRVICMAVGIFDSYCYSFIAKSDVFKNTYLTVISLLTSCIYLFITAFIEEIAWRGFLLERLPFKKIKSVLFVGAVWAVWHMPMWIIRNSLGMEQIVCLCIWTLLVSVVLGITYYQCRNILLSAIMHAIFNICYLAPVQYNIVVLATIFFVGTLLYKKSGKNFFT